MCNIEARGKANCRNKIVFLIQSFWLRHIVVAGLFQRYMGSYQGCGARIFSCRPIEYVVAKLSNEPLNKILGPCFHYYNYYDKQFLIRVIFVAPLALYSFLCR